MSPGNKVIVPDTLLHLDLVEEEAVKAGVDIVKTTAVTEQVAGKNCKIHFFNEWFETSIDSPLLQQNLVLALTLLKEEGVPVALLKQAAAAVDL